MPLMGREDNTSVPVSYLIDSEIYADEPVRFSVGSSVGFYCQYAIKKRVNNYV